MTVNVLCLSHFVRPPDSIRSAWGAAVVVAWLGLFAVCLGEEAARLSRASNPAATEAMPPAQAEAAALKREAVTAARFATEQYPDDALAYALLGSAHYNIGQSEEATRYLQKCLALRPDQGDAYEVLARAAYEKGELEEAVRYAGEAARRGVVSADLLNRWGRALLDLGRWEESVEVLQRALQLPRPVSESTYLLGQAYLQGGDPKRAKESFARAIALFPEHTQAHFGLFTANVRLGLSGEAEKARAEFVRLEAMDRQMLRDRSSEEETRSGLPQVRRTVARTLFGAGQVHRAHRQLELAEALLQRASLLDPDSPTYRSALEACYLQRKNPMEGLRVFQALTTAQPTNPLNHLFLARFQGRLEQTEAAEQSFQRVQELAPGSSDGYRALAELRLRLNHKLPEALALARQAVSLDPTGGNYYVLALALFKNGDRAGAQNAIREALARQPNDTRYQQLRQQIESRP